MYIYIYIEREREREREREKGREEGERRERERERREDSPAVRVLAVLQPLREGERSHPLPQPAPQRPQSSVWSRPLPSLPYPRTSSLLLSLLFSLLLSLLLLSPSLPGSGGSTAEDEAVGAEAHNPKRAGLHAAAAELEG